MCNRKEDIVKYWSDRLFRLRDEAPVGRATRVRLRHHGFVDHSTSDRHDHNAPHHRRCAPIVGRSDEYPNPTGTRLVTRGAAVGAAGARRRRVAGGDNGSPRFGVRVGDGVLTGSFRRYVLDVGV